MDGQNFDELPEESLENVSPTPVAAAAGQGVSGVWSALFLIGAGAFTYLLLGSSMSRTSGATRSARLQWEQRRGQIEQAAQECEAEEQRGPRSDG